MNDEQLRQILDVAVVNVKRLYRLRRKGKMSKDDKRDFLMYKNILVSNDTGVYTKETLDIIYNRQ